MTERKSSHIIEDLIISLENMIDALDDEYEYNRNGEWRRADNIRQNTLPLTKNKFKNFLDEYIDRRIETHKLKKNKQSPKEEITK